MKQSNKILLYGLLSAFVISVLIGIGVRIKSEFETGNQSSNVKSAVTDPEYSFNNFSKIETAGAWEVNISQGDKFQIKVFAPADVVDKIQVEQSGDTLSLGMKSDYWHTFGDRKIKAVIVMPKLSRISTSGAAKVYFSGFTGKDLSVDTSGAGEVNSKNNNITNLTIDNAGASKFISENDKITNLSLETSGASKMDFMNSTITNVNLDLSGASAIKLNMAGGTLKGQVSGAASVIYKGEVKSQEIQTSGMANIRKGF